MLQLWRIGQNCPKRNRAVAAIVDDEDGAEPIDAFQTVSVAFIIRDKCTELKTSISLFDSGSPVSCIQKSLIPFAINSEKTVSPYRGVGINRLSAHGLVKCKVIYAGRVVIHNFLVLPDEEAVVPLLFGRDILPKLKIQLCRIRKKYTKATLLSLNVNKNEVNELNKFTLSALMSFNILKSPRVEKLEIPAINDKYGIFNLPFFDKCNSNELTNDRELDNNLTNKNDVDATTSNVMRFDPGDIIDFGKVDQGCREQMNLISAIEAASECEIDTDPSLDYCDADIFHKAIEDCYIGKTNSVGEEINYSMRIRLSDDTPVFSPPRRLSYREREEVKRTLDDLLRQA